MRLLTSNISILFLLIVSAANASAQQRENVSKSPETRTDKSLSNAPCSNGYLGISTGINNNNGLLGVNLDVPVAKQFSISAGAGLSSWGGKLYAEGRFYFKDNCHRGWAIGLGVTHNTGVDNVPVTISEPNRAGYTEVFNLKNKTNVPLSAYYFFSLGKRHVNRFHLQFGYSISVTDTEYSIQSGAAVSRDTDNAIKLISPGGIILGLGFSFGVF